MICFNKLKMNGFMIFGLYNLYPDVTLVNDIGTEGVEVPNYIHKKEKKGIGLMHRI